MEERHDRLRKARIAAGFERPAEASRRFGFNENSYRAHENGNAPFSYKAAKDYASAFRVRVEWLMDAKGSMRDETPLVRIVGRVGANPDGSVIYVTGQETYDQVPPPPGASPDCVALEVVGDSQLPIIENGSILFVDRQHPEPTIDMIGGFPAVVETAGGQVLLKTIQRGAAPGSWDLISMNAAPIRDVAIVWAAEVTASYSPALARQVVLRSAEAA